MQRRTALRRKTYYKPVELERFHEFVADKGCLVCGFEATVHHVSAYADRPGRFGRSDWLVVPLCAKHHLYQHGPRESVEALGHRGFHAMHGVDLYAEAVRLAEQWRGE